jgi:hypothetical protein
MRAIGLIKVLDELFYHSLNEMERQPTIVSVGFV